jgi:hypothetical protein
MFYRRSSPAEGQTLSLILLANSPVPVKGEVFDGLPVKSLIERPSFFCDVLTLSDKPGKNYQGKQH